MKNKNLKQNKKPILGLARWLQRVSIYWLVAGPILIALLALSGLSFVGEKIYGKSPPEVYSATVGAVCVLIGSASGMFQVIRREGPGPFGEPVYGLWPVISGIILTVICWIAALCLLFYAFT